MRGTGRYVVQGTGHWCSQIVKEQINADRERSCQQGRWGRSKKGHRNGSPQSKRGKNKKVTKEEFSRSTRGKEMNKAMTAVKVRGAGGMD